MTLRELWSVRFFRVQVYLALEIAIIVSPLAYMAAQSKDKPPIEIAAPKPNSLLSEVVQ